MIIAIDDVLKIEGNKKEVLIEAAKLLHGLYGLMADDVGEEEARKVLHDLFRLAQMSKEEVRAAVDEAEGLDADAELLGQEPTQFLS